MQLGSFGVIERESPLRNPRNPETGQRRSWKAFGKKARMKIARKMQVFRRLVSKGIGSRDDGQI